MKLACGTIYVHPGGLRVQMHAADGVDEVRYDGDATAEALADAARVLARWMDLPSEQEELL